MTYNCGLFLRIYVLYSRVSVSRRTFGPGNVAVHAWFGSTAQLTKCIWSMAVAQHQFYLDRKHSKVTFLPIAGIYCPCDSLPNIVIVSFGFVWIVSSLMFIPKFLYFTFYNWLYKIILSLQRRKFSSNK